MPQAFRGLRRAGGRTGLQQRGAVAPHPVGGSSARLSGGCGRGVRGRDGLLQHPGPRSLRRQRMAAPGSTAQKDGLFRHGDFRLERPPGAAGPRHRRRPKRGRVHRPPGRGGHGHDQPHLHPKSEATGGRGQASRSVGRRKRLAGADPQKQTGPVRASF